MKRVGTLTQLDLASLIKEHQAGLWRFLRLLGCNPTQTEDLIQETFLSIWESNFKEYDPAATAVYLRTTAKRLYLATLKQQAREHQIEYIEQLEADWQRFGAEDGGELLIENLEGCLQHLDKRSREALTLRYHDNASRSEIAAKLKLSEDGAKNLLQRAKQRLRQCIERKMESR